jgi:hypothetical protein
MIKPRMIRSQYKLIAAAIKEANISDDARYEVVMSMKRALKGTNPAFDGEKFFKACFDDSAPT